MDDIAWHHFRNACISHSGGLIVLGVFCIMLRGKTRGMSSSGYIKKTDCIAKVLQISILNSGLIVFGVFCIMLRGTNSGYVGIGGTPSRKLIV